MRGEFERRAVGPVKIVEHEDERLLHGEALDQLARRAMGTVALSRGGRLIRARLERPQGGEHSAELGQGFGLQAVEHPRSERLEVLVEGVDDQAEGQVALELGRAPPQRKAPPLLGPTEELGQERGLADTRFARDEHDLRRSRTPFVEYALEQIQLGMSANECLSQFNHATVNRWRLRPAYARG